MLKAERQYHIVEFVNQEKVASVEELSVHLKASKATIRRDLEELNRKGVLIRTHGGATSKENPGGDGDELPITIRSQLNRVGKEAVARAAVDLLKEGATVFIGPGSTARLFSEKLGKFHNLTVLTNDIDVAKEVSKTDNPLVVTGGQLKKNSCTLHGFFTEQMLQEIKVDIAFMSADAVNLKSGFMDIGVDEITIKRMVLHNAKQRVMLCDSGKFKASAFVHICEISDVDVIVTNHDIDPEIEAQLTEANIQVVYE